MNVVEVRTQTSCGFTKVEQYQAATWTKWQTQDVFVRTTPEGEQTHELSRSGAHQHLAQLRQKIDYHKGKNPTHSVIAQLFAHEYEQLTELLVITGGDKK